MQIVFRGDTLGSSGYSTTTRNYVIGLYELGVDVRVEQESLNMGSRNVIPPHQREILEKCMHKTPAKNFVYVNRVSLEYFKPNPKAKLNIASTAWETDRLPLLWTNLINNGPIDMVIVPSLFNQAMFKSSGVLKPVEYVRECIDFKEFNNLEVHPTADDSFKFLSVFQWLPRKGYDILLRAYLEEFTPEDNVSLSIKTSTLHPGFFPTHQIFDEARAIKQEICNDIPIYINVKDLPSTDVRALYKGHDCFVLPTRGEGSCIPVLECMISKIPIIVTGWSGQMSFLEEGMAKFIDYDMVSVPQQWYTPSLESSQNWAEPSKNHLKKLMRAVYNNREESKTMAEKAYANVLNFSAESAACDIIKAVESAMGSVF